VSLELLCKKGETPTLELNQRRQLPVGSKGDANLTWQLPLCVRYSVAGKETRTCTLLTKVLASIPLEAKACPDWVMPNDGMRGYYRSSMRGTSDLPGLLKKADKKLSVAERVGLLDDVNAAVDSGDVEVSTALSAIPLALKGDERHLLDEAQGIAARLEGDLLPEALRPKYEAFVRDTFGARALKLGLTVGKKDNEDLRLSRPWLVRMVAVEGKEPTLRAKSLTMAKSWLKDRKSVHADLVSSVLSTAADSGDAEFHDALIAAVKTEKDRADRGRILNALSGFRDPALVKSQLALALDKDLDAREGMQVLWGASWDYRTRPIALEFLKDNWDALVARMPEDSASSLVWMGGSACDEKTRDEVKKYFDGRSTKFLGGQREFDQAMEGVDLCIAWRAKHRASAERFLTAWEPAVANKKAK
jgi:alanyl aminopeptidase